MLRSQPETLAEFVRRKRESHDPPLSLADVENQSARYGRKISESYVSRIENGHSRNPGKNSLIALAYGLNVPLAELIAIAEGKPLAETDAQEEQLLILFRSLPDDRRADVLRIIRTLHKEHGARPAEVRQIKKAGRRSAA